MIGWGAGVDLYQPLIPNPHLNEKLSICRILVLYRNDSQYREYGNVRLVIYLLVT